MWVPSEPPVEAPVVPSEPSELEPQAASTAAMVPLMMKFRRLMADSGR